MEDLYELLTIDCKHLVIGSIESKIYGFQLKLQYKWRTHQRSLSVGNFGLEGILKRENERKEGKGLTGALGRFWGSMGFHIFMALATRKKELKDLPCSSYSGKLQLW